MSDYLPVIDTLKFFFCMVPLRPHSNGLGRPVLGCASYVR